MRSEATVLSMLSVDNVISQPAYEHIPEDMIAESLSIQAKKLADSQNNRPIPIRYHNRNQTEEEQEELTIAGAFEEAKNLKDLK